MAGVKVHPVNFRYNQSSVIEKIAQEHRDAAVSGISLDKTGRLG
jgi:hypothetical protein